MPEGREEISGIQEESEPIESEGIESDQTEAESDSGPETARETVEKQLKLLQGEDSRDEGEESASAEKLDVVKRRPGRPRKEESFEVPPPNRLNAAQKEIFNKLPPDLRRATHDMFKQHEGLLTRTMQEARAAQKEASHIVETVRPYLLAHPELQAEGYTESRIVSGLIAAHQRLTNPKTAKKAYAELGAQLGLDQETIEQILGAGGNGGDASADISSHPQFQALQQKLNEVTSVIEQQQGAQRSAFVSSILSEMEEVRDEKDQFGRYLYPKLHDPDFLEMTKPLVSALVAKRPDLGYGEALRRVYYTLEGQSGNLSQVSQARLPQRMMSNSSAAAVSVRGRSAPPIAGETEEIPPEALKDARATTAWALKQLRRG